MLALFFDTPAMLVACCLLVTLRRYAYDMLFSRQLFRHAVDIFSLRVDFTMPC